MVTRAREPGPPAREIPHTADVGFEVDAPTLPLLFERAGLALLAVMADVAGVAPRERAVVTIAAGDVVELLHDWLHALLVRVQTGGFLPCELDVSAVDGRTLRASLAGEPFDAARHRLRREVKAVTYHELSVARDGDRWRARVILDV